MNDDFEIVGDAAREARIVAVVLGEASAFEREEVDRLCEENPELQVFRRRMEAVHGLMGENKQGEPKKWQLSSERREVLLSKMGEKETVVDLPPRKKRLLRLSGLHYAALFAVLIVLAGLAVPTRMRALRSVESAHSNSPGIESDLARFEQESVSRRQSGLVEEALASNNKGRANASQELAELVTVTGQVKKPGTLSYNREMTLADAVGDAGGVSTFGTTKRVHVYREGKKYTLDLSKEEHRNERIYPNDTVEVDQVKAWESGGEGESDRKVVSRIVLPAMPAKPNAPTSSLGREIAAATESAPASPPVTPAAESFAFKAQKETGDASDFGNGWGGQAEASSPSAEKKEVAASSDNFSAGFTAMDTDEAPLPPFEDYLPEEVVPEGLAEAKQSLAKREYFFKSEATPVDGYGWALGESSGGFNANATSQAAWSGSVTSGLRSGDFAVGQSNIDAILNNPNRTAGGSANLEVPSLTGLYDGEEQLEVVAEEEAMESDDPFTADGGLGGAGLRFRSGAEREEALAGARVVGESNGRPLLEQRFTLPPDALTKMKKQMEDSFSDADPFAAEPEPARGLSARQSVSELLGDMGVDLPEGASARYIPSTGELVVKNTAENIDLVDQIANNFAEEKPRSIVVDTKFVDVTQANTDELGFDWMMWDEASKPDLEGFMGGGVSIAGNTKTSDGVIRREVPQARGNVDFDLDLSEVASGSFFATEGDSKEALGLDAGILPPLDSEAEVQQVVSGGGMSVGGGGGGLLSVERIRREASTEEAVDALMAGREAYANKDYEQATRLYYESLNLLPHGPKTEVKRNEIAAHLADGSVALAQQYRRMGKYDEAKALLDGVLEVDPDRFESGEAGENFDDPARVNPSLTNEHSENVDEIRRLLYQGEGFYNLADFDKSVEKFHEVLRIDPYNKAARRWLERNAAIKSDYYRAAYDHTRAQLLMETDKAWELTVPSDVARGGLKKDLGLLDDLFEQDEVGLLPSRSESESLFPTKYEPPELPNQVAQGNKRETGVSDRSLLITNKLQNVIIPRIDFENTPLDEAIEYLTQKSIELDTDPDPARKGINFVIERGAVPSSYGDDNGDLLLGSVEEFSEKSIDVLKLRNVPLSTALDYIAAKTGLRYRVDEFAVTLLPIGSSGSADLVTRTWKISPEEYRALMTEATVTAADDPFASEDEELSSEEEALRNSGVDFPGGSSVRYLEESGVMVVRNCISNLDLVDQIIVNLGERVKAIEETLAMDEKDAASQADSTFSLHVSDVSFKLAKAALDQGKWPETVRVEEFVNAFSYGERQLLPGERVGVAMEQAAHPFLSQRNLLRISLQTAATGRGAGVPLRLTVVLDKSGSMERLDRASAVDEAFRVLTEQLNPGDKVTLVGFSRTPTLLADFVDGAEGDKLLKILRETPSEGGTNVEEALKLARAKAIEHYQDGAQNRVILLTDGIANLGTSVPEQLMTLVEGMREEGVAFDACGVGVEGLNDDILEALTRKGDGRYYLLGSTEESGADFAKQVAGALRPAAQNVKVQVIWNPERVGKWRLYGFEKHELKKEDFRNDAVDAAEMAAEEEGVALYHVEVKPDGEGSLGVARVRFLDVANNEMVEREWEIFYQGDAPNIRAADPKVRLAGVAGLVAEKLARSSIGERVEWDDLLEVTRQLKGIFPKEKRVGELEGMIEKAKQLE